MVQIKICGLTRREDLEFVVSLRVDYVGFVLAQSPRSVTLGQACDLARAAHKKIHTVAVLANVVSETEICSVVETGVFDFVQIHGSMPDLKKIDPGVIIRAVRVKNSTQEVVLTGTEAFYGVLFDTYQKERMGGTGQTFDWSKIKSCTLPNKVFLSGGLSPDNVGEAIAAVQPDVVDASSGLEDTPGVKNHVKIKQFVRSARSEVL